MGRQCWELQNIFFENYSEQGLTQFTILDFQKIHHFLLENVCSRDINSQLQFYNCHLITTAQVSRMSAVQQVDESKGL